jgi:hypothetical protein
MSEPLLKRSFRAALDHVQEPDRAGLIRLFRIQGVVGVLNRPVSLYTAGPVLADRIGVAVLIGCDS